MKIICFILIFLGALIMAVSLFSYYKTLRFMHRQNYEEKSFQSPVYKACFIMIIFFLIGYIIVGFNVTVYDYESYYILIAVIFFFGAVFVYFIVKVQDTLTKTIMKQTLELLESMINIVEVKDSYTKGHSEHVKNLVSLLYMYFPHSMKQKLNLGRLEDAALLHDIGKIGISDNILNKPGKLTAEEIEIISEHPLRGIEILKNSCYRDISEWILYHHERVDGMGYYNIPEEKIPLEAKIIALADTFSALSTDRIYRSKFTYEESIKILNEISGNQLDKELVNIFLGIPKEEVESTIPDKLNNGITADKTTILTKQ